MLERQVNKYGPAWAVIAQEIETRSADRKIIFDSGPNSLCCLVDQNVTQNVPNDGNTAWTQSSTEAAGLWKTYAKNPRELASSYID